MNENLSLTHEELLICERLRSLRMSGMADAFESQMLDPNADLAPFIERFTEIVNHEWQIRYDKKFKRYLKQAHLRYPDADLDETIYDPARKLDTDAIERLATCHWIDEGKNLPDYRDDKQRENTSKQCLVYLCSSPAEDGAIYPCKHAHA